MNAASSKGISSKSCCAEAFVFLHTLAYSRHLGYSFDVYGENFSILIQQAILLSLVYKYDPDVSIIEKILFVAFFLSYSTWLMMDTNVPEEAWPIVSGSVLMFNLSARIPQIWSNYSS